MSVTDRMILDRYYADMPARLAARSPDRRDRDRDKIAARIDQVRSIIAYSGYGGLITLSAAEHALGDSITSRLYRERCRPDDPTDTLAMRCADAFVSRFLTRLAAHGGTNGRP